MKPKIRYCLECGKKIHIIKPSMNAKKYCCSKCRITHNKKHTKISIRKCAWCGKEYVAIHTRHISKFCSEKHSYYSRLDSNLHSVRKYQRKYNTPTKQAWLGNSNLKSHANTDFNTELKQIRNELARLGIKSKYGSANQ